MEPLTFIKLWRGRIAPNGVGALPMQLQALLMSLRHGMAGLAWVSERGSAPAKANRKCLKFCYVAPMCRSKGQAKPNAEHTQTGLRLQPPAEVLSALLRERSRLLEKIALKRQELEQECESIKSTMQTLMSKMHGLLAERALLVEEMHRLFGELLAQGRLSRSAHKKVSSVYQTIKESPDFEPLECDPFAPRPNPQTGNGFSDTDASDAEAASQRGPSTLTARHAGGQPGNDSLRGLFRRLTMALHPDRARHEAEQKRRTAVMMEVTRAYEEGDFARLIEIEQRWMTGGNVASTAHDETAKRVTLERTIEELQSQLKAVTSELRMVRASSPIKELFGHTRKRRANNQGPIDTMVAAANEDLERMRQTRDFVRSFNERRISLAEFMRGPAHLRPDNLDEEFDFARLALESLFDEFEMVPVNRRKAKRSSTASNVPF